MQHKKLVELAHGLFPIPGYAVWKIVTSPIKVEKSPLWYQMTAKNFGVKCNSFQQRKFETIYSIGLNGGFWPVTHDPKSGSKKVQVSEQTLETT